MTDLKSELKLIALDAEDLTVLSAHLQDAVLRIGDMAFFKAQQRFAAVINRFDWETAAAGQKSPAYARRRAGLRFERVNSAQFSNINLSSGDTVLSLLAIDYAVKSAPEGSVTLHFSGGGAIRLNVECIEAELRDLGAAWATENVPAHGESDPSGWASGKPPAGTGI